MGDAEKKQKQHHQQRHHHHRRRREQEEKEGEHTATQSHTEPPVTTTPVDPDTSELVRKFVTKEAKMSRDKKEKKPAVVIRQPNYLTDRRISQAEMQRRHTWLQRTRLSVAMARNRCRITHEVRFPETFNGLYCSRFSPDGEIIATSFGTGCIQVRNGETGETRNTMRSGLDTSFPVMCCRFNPIRSDVFYASSACGNIFACTTSTNEFSRFIEEPKNEVNTIDVSVTGEYIVSAGKDAAVRLYDAETGQIVTTYKKHNADLLDEKISKFHRMRIFASRFHHTYPELIITGGWDDTVKIWDTRLGDGSIRSIKGPHICGDAIDVRETHILTGSWVVRGSLQIWDMMSGKLIETINPQNRPTTLDGEFLYAVQYFDGDPYGETVLAGGSGTGAVEVISLKEKKWLSH
ncbi:suppressor of mec-8 and unc-52 protein homolog 1 isoform X2 [Cephus cinctus]|uniref:Suppressor of mec-8 and unc-52 protein homolog 1 isoform X2 n=1 Tax=Cephus cinctus TaxID=211228 RepID=A0AAJ7RM54_CEPCN|nr:suppressor of mec-8 and unc-52 protein homolog 1 isoform X2 [Cephus cinctus]